MIEVTLREIDRGAVALKRLADNAKLPPALFIKIRNAWRDAREYLETIEIKQQDSLYAHYVLVSRNTAGQETFTPKSQEGGQAHEIMMRNFLKESVQLLHVKEKIAWKMIEDAKIESPLTPAEVVSLAWLIELPEEQ